MLHGAFKHSGVGPVARDCLLAVVLWTTESVRADASTNPKQLQCLRAQATTTGFVGGKGQSGSREFGDYYAGIIVCCVLLLQVLQSDGS